MKKKVYSLQLTVYSLIFILLSNCFVNISCAQKEGDKAQDFTIEDMAGNKVSLQEIVNSNKAALLVFWATWCPYCRREVPDLIKLQNEYSKKGLKILGINLGESKKKVESFSKQEGINYTVLLDTDNVVASQYGIMGIPANILVDKEGVIKYRGTSPPSEDLLPK